MSDTITHDMISAEDLTELQEVAGRANQVLFNLGCLTEKRMLLDSEEAQLKSDLEQVKRDRNHLHNRVIKKYGIADGKNIDLSTGEIV